MNTTTVTGGNARSADQLVQLAVAPRRGVARGVDDRRTRPLPHDRMRGQPVGVIGAELHRARIDLEAALDAPRRGRRQQHLAGARVSEQALGQRERIADREELRDRIGRGGVEAHLADVHRGAQFGAGRGAVLGGAHDHQRRLHGALRHLLERARNAEDRGQPRRCALHDLAPEPFDALDQRALPARRGSPRFVANRRSGIGERQRDRQHRGRLLLPHRRLISAAGTPSQGGVEDAASAPTGSRSSTPV
jgi:hypothetical protein